MDTVTTKSIAGKFRDIADKLQASAIFVIPLIYLLVCFLYINFMGSYALVTIDPEFNYLFNGILLSHFKLHLNAVGHPGTPIQILIAIVARIVNLFRPGQSLWDDVLMNPDIYIRSTVYTAAFINTISLVILGKKVFSKSASLISAVFMQLTPFAFLLTLEESNRMMPELIMPSIIALWIILLTGLLYAKPGGINYKRYALNFGILMGFSLSDKLTFIPFVFLPFIVLPGIKLRLRYLIFTVASFCLFAFPVLFNSNKFILWVYNLFTHKGVYGGGDKGIVDINLFVQNLKFLVHNSYQLLIPVLLLTFYSLTRLAGSRANNPARRIALGIGIVVAVQYIITAKHFAFYYMTPSLLLSAFAGFLICEILRTESVPKWLSETILLTFGLVLVVSTFLKTGDQLKSLKERKLTREQSFKTVEPLLRNRPRIIVPDYFNCSSPEYALTFGLHESGRYSKDIQGIIEKHYPETYMYFPWSGNCYKNTRLMNTATILKPGVEYALLVCNDSEQMVNRIIDALSRKDEQDPLQIIRIAESKATREAVYTIKRTLP